MDIRYVNYGIANNFGEYIEINKNLIKYPKLYDSVLKHELSHTNIKGFTKKDFILDMTQEVDNFELLKFIVRYPKALLQFLPIYKKNKVWIYDLNMIYFYSIFFILLICVLLISI